MAKKLSAVQKGGKLNVQSGQDGSKKPAKARVKAAQAAAADQFAEADAKGAPSKADAEQGRIDEIQAGLSVRGY